MNYISIQGQKLLLVFNCKYLNRIMNLFTADYGNNKFHIYDSGNDKFHGKITKQNFVDLNLSGLEQGDTLVVECAHLREWHKKTMAQPLKFDELVDFKKNCDQKGVAIKLFPQKSTPKARKLSGYESQKTNAKFQKLYGISTDEADTRSIANFLLEDRSAFYALKDFVPTKLVDYQDKDDSVFNYIQQSNEDINPAKTQGYGFSTDNDNDYEDNISRWIRKYGLKLTEYLNGDMELIQAIGLKYLKNGTLKVEVPNRIYTLVHSILRPDGKLRFRLDRENLSIDDRYKVPEWKYIKAHYLGCKPYHSQQGVAASNYKHWMRIAVSEYAYPGKKNANTSDFQLGMSQEELAKLKKARTKVDKMTQQIWYALRKMIVEDGLR